MHFDPRSLAVFRIALAIIVLALAVQLDSDFSAFYGTGPVDTWLTRILLEGILPVCSISLALGFVTRACTLCCWLGVVAAQAANPQILYGADTELRLLLYWAIFLPLGAVWSADARLVRQPYFTLPLAERAASWAIVLQLCLIYWSAAALKTGATWRQNHDALAYALKLEYLTTPTGSALTSFPQVLRGLTVACLCLEFLGPFLLFSPFYRDRCRMLAVILFLTFHLIGLQTLLRLGFFPWVSSAPWLMLLPAFFWDRIFGPRIRTDPMPPVRQTLRLDRGLALLVVFSVLDSVAWNALSLRGEEGWMQKWDVTRNILHLNQRWKMYAPNPPSDHGWLVDAADLVDGTKVNLFTGGPLSWERPADIAGYMGDDRWLAYLDGIINGADPVKLQAYSTYVSEEWNRHHSANRKIQQLSIIYMKETTRPDLSVSSPERVLLYTRKF